MDLFRGYIKTQNKSSLDKFKDCDLRTYDEVKEFDEFGGVLGKDTILIDFDDKESADIGFKIIEELGLICRVVETTRGIHCFFKNTNVNKCYTHTKLACGLTADIKVGVKNSYAICKFSGAEREIIYDKFDDEEYDTVPDIFLPVTTNFNLLELKEGEGRNNKLFSYILPLQENKFTKDQIIKILDVVNKYVFKEPLSKEEFETITRDESFTVSKPTFFKGNTFFFDKFAHYIKDTNHIVKLNGALHIYNNGVYSGTQRDIQSAMIQHIPELNRTKREEVLAYLNLLIEEDLKCDYTNLIPFKNGLYNIVDGSISEFSPSKVVTNKIDWCYRPDAYNELLDHTLNKIAGFDPTVRALLEECVGYTLFRKNELGASFVLLGGGANGKSTFLDLVSTMLGRDNVSSLDLKELGERFKPAQLVGKLANIGDDISDDFVKDSSMFKKLVTGGRINTENKGTDLFEFDCYTKFLFSCNDMPRIKDRTGAVLRRLVIIPFNGKFTAQDPDFDPYIKYKLREDTSIEYLIRLGVEGLQRILKNNKFTKCDKVKQELKEYDEFNNPIISFFEDENTKIENESVTECYKNYMAFCIDNGMQAMSKIEFGKQVRKYYGFDTKSNRINGVVVKVYVKGED